MRSEIAQSSHEVNKSNSGFAQIISAIATDQWVVFGNQVYDLSGNATHVGHKEGEDGWYQRIGQYWIDGTNTHGIDGRDHSWAWSAAFISWVMKTGNAGTRFRYSTQHSVYISQAIRDRLQSRMEAGYWGCRLNEVKPHIGDLVCWSRQPGVDYDHQAGGNYPGHCDVIIEATPSEVVVIGGNVGDSVTRRPLRLDSGGFLSPTVQGSEYVFALMQNRIG